MAKEMSEAARLKVAQILARALPKAEAKQKQANKGA